MEVQHSSLVPFPPRGSVRSNPGHDRRTRSRRNPLIASHSGYHVRLDRGHARSLLVLFESFLHPMATHHSHHPGALNGGPAAPAPATIPSLSASSALHAVNGDASDDRSPTGAGYKRASRKGAPKKFQCQHEGCDKVYSRAEHLQRHQLNRQSLMSSPFLSLGSLLTSLPRVLQMHQRKYFDAMFSAANKSSSAPTSSRDTRSDTPPPISRGTALQASAPHPRGRQWPAAAEPAAAAKATTATAATLKLAKADPTWHRPPTGHHMVPTASRVRTTRHPAALMMPPSCSRPTQASLPRLSRFPTRSRLRLSRPG